MHSFHFNSTIWKELKNPLKVSVCPTGTNKREITCFRNVILTCDKCPTMLTRCTCSLKETKLGDTQDVSPVCIGTLRQFNSNATRVLLVLPSEILQWNLNMDISLSLTSTISIYQANLRLISKFLPLLWRHVNLNINFITKLRCKTSFIRHFFKLEQNNNKPNTEAWFGISCLFAFLYTKKS